MLTCDKGNKLQHMSRFANQLRDSCGIYGKLLTKQMVLRLIALGLEAIASRLEAIV